jgi:hypothetical protein
VNQGEIRGRDDRWVRALEIGSRVDKRLELLAPLGVPMPHLS